MKYIYFFLFFFCIKFTLAQKEVISIPSYENVNETISIVDSTSQRVAVINFKNKLISAYLLDKDFNVLESIVTKPLPNKLKSVIAHQFQNKKLSLFMNTSSNRKYATAVFDFETGNCTTHEIDFKLKKEIFFTTFSRDDKIFIVSVSKKGSQLNIYEFYKNLNEPKKTEIKIPENTFLDRFGDSVDLKDVLSDSYKNGFMVSPVTIQKNLPATIEKTRRPLKIYLTEKGFDVTVDTWLKSTFLLNVSLEDMTVDVSEFKYPKPDGFIARVKANSFLFDDNLFQIIMGSDEMLFSVFSAQTKELRKEILLKKGDEIDFRNTPIVQNGGAFESFRYLENTKQFFRKSLDADIGLSVIKKNEIYEITFGSVKEIEDPVVLYFVVGGVVGGTVSLLVRDLLDYRLTKSVEFRSLFSNKIEHLEGDVSPNLFDKIGKFTKGIKLKSETLFQFNGSYYYGHYNLDRNTYLIYKIIRD